MKHVLLVVLLSLLAVAHAGGRRKLAAAPADRIVPRRYIVQLAGDTSSTPKRHTVGVASVSRKTTSAAAVAAALSAEAVKSANLSIAALRTFDSPIFSGLAVAAPDETTEQALLDRLEGDERVAAVFPVVRLGRPLRQPRHQDIESTLHVTTPLTPACCMHPAATPQTRITLPKPISASHSAQRLTHRSVASAAATAAAVAAAAPAPPAVAAGAGIDAVLQSPDPLVKPLPPALAIGNSDAPHDAAAAAPDGDGGHYAWHHPRARPAPTPPAPIRAQQPPAPLPAGTPPFVQSDGTIAYPAVSLPIGPGGEVVVLHPARAWGVADALTNVTMLRQRYNATGRGVRIGFLDSGIDYTHPAFGSCSAVGVPAERCRVVAG